MNNILLIFTIFTVCELKSQYGFNYNLGGVINQRFEFIDSGNQNISFYTLAEIKEYKIVNQEGVKKINNTNGQEVIICKVKFDGINYFLKSYCAEGFLFCKTNGMQYVEYVLSSQDSDYFFNGYYNVFYNYELNDTMEIGYFENGLKTGVWLGFFNKRLTEVIQYEKNKQTRKKRIGYYKNGAVEFMTEEFPLKQNKRITVFYINGSIKLKGVMNSNNRIKEWAFYYETGRLFAKGSYSKKNKEIWVNDTVFKNAKRKSLEYYKKGVWRYYSREGKYIKKEKYYESGELIYSKLKSKNIDVKIELMKQEFTEMSINNINW
jgi:hypothetical protein